MRRTMITFAAIGTLAGCAMATGEGRVAAQGAEPTPQELQEAWELVELSCGEPQSREDPAFGECYAQLMAQARTKLQCADRIGTLSPEVRRTVEVYHMQHGRIPPGLEIFCGNAAYEAHLRQARKEVQEALR